jgi:hypothetical protein
MCGLHHRQLHKCTWYAKHMSFTMSQNCKDTCKKVNSYSSKKLGYREIGP